MVCSQPTKINLGITKGQEEGANLGVGLGMEEGIGFEIVVM